ncbi:MAG: hypothetical protein ACFFC3_06890 [Candidatus Odinarchaeota archaeon]
MKNDNKFWVFSPELDSNFEEKAKKLIDKRIVFITDRVAFSLIFNLILIGFLKLIINLFGINQFYSFMNRNFEIIFLILLMIIGLILIGGHILTRIYQNDSNNTNWWICFLALKIIEIPIFLGIGVAIDYYMGIGKTFAVSSFLALIFFVGYMVSRNIRNIRYKKSKKTIYRILIAIILLISFTLIIIGLIKLYGVMRIRNISTLYTPAYGKFSVCLPCALWTIIMISGVLLPIFILLSYWMFSLLYKSKRWNVVYNSPKKLFLIFLGIGSAIILIIWILVGFMIPPIPLAGGGGGSDSGGGGKKNRSNFNSFSNNKNVITIKRTINQRTFLENFGANMQWEKYNLGKDYFHNLL